jgi:hypothetical protein
VWVQVMRLHSGLGRGKRATASPVPVSPRMHPTGRTGAAALRWGAADA